jgi:endoglucanase
MLLLKELCETPAISGREQPLIDVMRRELALTCDSVSVDGMGNVVGFKRGSAKDARKVMIAGHMDEIGFVVSHIDKEGFLRLAPRGGHVPRVLISQRVRILGRKELVGVVEGPPALLEKERGTTVAAMKDFHVDTGMGHKEIVKWVRVGDPVVLDRGLTAQGDCYISKAFDNRVGCYVVLEAMKRLGRHAVDVYAVGSTQEEVGIRGMKRAARSVTPDLGIAVDVTGAFDTPGVPEHERVTTLGGGAAIKINDQATISNHGIVEHLRALATKHRIKHQLEVLPFGGTDAGGMQLFGDGAVCTISVPTRYVHSPNEIIHKGDLEASVALLVKFLESAQHCKLVF